MLTPGRYVGAPAEAEDGEPFEARMQRLTDELKAQMAEGETLEARIRERLAGVGYA